GLTNELSAMTSRLRDRLDELTEERDRAGQILDALDDGVLLLDGAGRLLVANPAARSWFGLPDDLRPGLPVQRVLGAPQVTALGAEAGEARGPAGAGGAAGQRAARGGGRGRGAGGGHPHPGVPRAPHAHHARLPAGRPRS